MVPLGPQFPASLGSAPRWRRAGRGTQSECQRSGGEAEGRGNQKERSGGGEKGTREQEEGAGENEGDEEDEEEEARWRLTLKRAAEEEGKGGPK